MNPISKLVENQRAYFRSGSTLSYPARSKALHALHTAILAHEDEIHAALQADLGKSRSESYLCEVGMTLSELTYMQRHLRRFMRRRRILSPLAQFPASSFTVKNPYGVALVMSPWNYPFLLTMDPLIGALAAGNCCVLKPSAYAPATSRVIAKIISACFAPEYVSIQPGIFTVPMSLHCR